MRAVLALCALILLCSGCTPYEPGTGDYICIDGLLYFQPFPGQPYERSDKRQACKFIDGKVVIP